MYLVLLNVCLCVLAYLKASNAHPSIRIQAKRREAEAEAETR